MFRKSIKMKLEIPVINTQLGLISFAQLEMKHNRKSIFVTNEHIRYIFALPKGDDFTVLYMLFCKINMARQVGQLATESLKIRHYHWN